MRGQIKQGKRYKLQLAADVIVGSSANLCSILFIIIIGTPIGIKGAIAAVFPTIPSIKTLNYDNTTFFMRKAAVIHFLAPPLEIANNTAILNFNNTIFAVWSKPLQQHNVNFVEDRFRVIYRTNPDNHAGVVWNDGHKIWYVFLRERGLSIYNSVDKEFARNTKMIVQNGAWNTLAVALLKNGIDIYVDNVLGLQIPYASASSYTIYNVGIKNFNGIAEFKPIKVGQVSPASLKYAAAHKMLTPELYYK